MTRPARIAVIGCGPVGTVTAAGLAELGHTVVAVDTNHALVAQLTAGTPPFYEPELPKLITDNLSRGRLTFTSAHNDAFAGVDFVFLCVDTPATATGAADLTAVRGAVRQAAAILRDTGQRPIVVYKSTAPIGTGDTIRSILQAIASEETPPDVVANPEFLREGTAVADFFHPSRIVIGSDSAEAAARVEALYAGVDAPRVCTDLRTAELIKYVSNAFLATRVSFVNEIARLCEALDTDVEPVIRGVGMDPRIGHTFFTPGIGYGGSCLPKDVAALCHTGDSTGMAMRLLSAVQDINSSQCKHAVNSIRRRLGSLEGKTIAVWGVTFKGGTADLRHSPALSVIALLQNEGAAVRVYDPTLDGMATIPGAAAICTSPDSAVEQADALAVLSDWEAFRRASWVHVRSLMAGTLIYDGRNALSRAGVEAAGLVYHGVGRPPARDRLASSRIPSPVVVGR